MAIRAMTDKQADILIEQNKTLLKQGRIIISLLSKSKKDTEPMLSFQMDFIKKNYKKKHR